MRRIKFYKLYKNPPCDVRHTSLTFIKVKLSESAQKNTEPIYGLGLLE